MQVETNRDDVGKRVPSPGRPRGFVPIGVFFVFGATMAAYAAVTLLKPGTLLDTLWALNKHGHEQLAGLGRIAALPFSILSVALPSKPAHSALLGMGAGHINHSDQHGWGYCESRYR